MPGVGAHLRLVGRPAELLAGRAALARVADGVGQAIVFEGEAGIGKTRLVDELLEEAASRGLQVFRGAAHELEQSLPFAAIADVLRLDPRSDDADRAAVGRLLMGGEGGDDSERVRLRMVQAVIDLIDGLCHDAPVVLALEDVHWADPSTLVVVARLVRRLQFLQLCLVLTRRPYPEPTAVRSLLDVVETAGARRVPLLPLADDDVNALLRELLGADAGPGLTRQVAAAGGNPLFITELVAALHHEGRITLGPHTVDAAVSDVPPSLRITILRRLGVLPKDTVEALRLAAVLGSSFDVDDLAVVGGRAPTEVSIVLDPALRSGVIQGSANRLAFRHDLIHEAIYADLPLAMRGSLHAHAARALTAAGRSPLHVAPHLLRGAAPGDPEAVDRLRRAAAEAGPISPEISAELLRRAVEVAPPDHPERYELEAELAESLAAARRPFEAESLARKLLDQRRGGRPEYRVRLILADALMARHRAGDAIGHLEAAFREADLSDAERALLAVRIGVLWTIRCDLDRSEAWAAEAVVLAQKVGHAGARAAGLVLLAIVCNYRGFRNEAQQLAEEAAVLSEAPLWLDPRAFQGHLLASGDHPARGIAVLREELRRHEQVASPLDAVLHESVALAQFRMGDWGDAITEWEVVLRIREETERGGTWFAKHALSYLALARDDLAGAESWLERADAALAGDDTRPLGLALVGYVHGLLEEARGAPARALQLLDEASRRLREIEYRNERIAVDMTRVAVTQGERAMAEEAAGDAALLAEGSRTAWARASAVQCRGLADADPDLLLEAVAIWRQTSWLPATAAASFDAARALVAVRRSSEAVPVAQEALAGWERVRAPREIARAESLLRDLGVHRGRRGTRGRPRSGWESLTETERRVVELVAEGLTYREVADRLFVSRRTVETHVVHVFGKLGVSSRRELSRAWQAR